MIEKARLVQGTPVPTIATDLGYANLSVFISMFRRALGETP
ncbi:helix-turn-helix domain-containing protein [Burkholderia sp. DHOD12]